MRKRENEAALVSSLIIHKHATFSDSPAISPESSPVRVLPNGFEEKADGTAVFDPFFDSQQNHSLVGVANVFLEVLFHELKLDYQVG